MVSAPSALDGNQTLKGAYDDANSAFRVNLISELIPQAYDYIALTYVAAGPGTGEIQTVTYKTGGAGGTTVAVLTLTYDGSNRLSTITRS